MWERRHKQEGGSSETEGALRGRGVSYWHVTIKNQVCDRKIIPGYRQQKNSEEYFRKGKIWYCILLIYLHVPTAVQALTEDIKWQIFSLINTSNFFPSYSMHFYS